MSDEILKVIVQLGGDWKKLEKIKTEGLTAKLNVKLGGDWNKLQKLRTDGINIKVNLKLGGDFNKLQNLSTKGVNISSGSTSTPGTSQQQLNNQEVQRLNAAFAAANKSRIEAQDRQLKQLFAQQAQNFNAKQPGRAFYNSPAGPQNTLQDAINRYRQATASTSALNQPELDAVAARRQQQFSQQAAERLRRANQQGFANQFKQEEANRLFSRSSALFSDEDETKNQLAFRFGLTPQQINSKRKLVDLNRLKDPEAVREIAFAGLFGKGVLGKAAGIAGGVVGGALGPGGAFLGSTVAQLGVEAAEGTFEKLGDALKNAAEKGIQFQQAIIAISAGLQASTTLVDEQGVPLDALAQAKGQQQRARTLQVSARANLLPIGIAGEAEAAYARSVSTGLSNKGINLSPDQFGKFVGALGAAQVALRPDLSSNHLRLQKDLNDLVSGKRGNNTELGIALGPDLTKEIGNAKTSEDIERLTQKLNKFREAVEKSDQAALQLLKFDGALDKLNTDLGDAFFKSFGPGLKILADALSDETLDKAFKNVGAFFGTLASFGAGVAGNAIKVVTLFIEGLQTAFKGLGPALKGVYNNIKEIIEKLNSSLPGGIRVPNLPDLDEDNKPVGGTPKLTPSKEVEKLFKNIGIESSSDELDKLLKASPEFQLDSLNKIQDFILHQTTKVQEELNDSLIVAFEGQFKAYDDIFKRIQGETDSDTLPGKDVIIDAAKDFLAAARDVIAGELEAAQVGLALAVEPEDKEKYKSIILGLDSRSRGLDKFEQQTVTRGGIQRNQFETDTNKKLEDAQLDLSHIAEDQANKFKDLTSALEAASNSLTGFRDHVNEAYASQDEKLLNAAKAAEDAGNITPFHDLLNNPDYLADIKKQATAAQFNAAQREVGNSTLIPLGRSEGLYGLQGGNFQTGLKQEEQKLKEEVLNVSRDLSDLDRQFRYLGDSLRQLTDLLKQLPKPTAPVAPVQLYDPNKPLTNIPGIPGGNSLPDNPDDFFFPKTEEDKKKVEEARKALERGSNRLLDNDDFRQQAGPEGVKDLQYLSDITGNKIGLSAGRAYSLDEIDKLKAKGIDPFPQLDLNAPMINTANQETPGELFGDDPFKPSSKKLFGGIREDNPHLNIGEGIQGNPKLKIGGGIPYTSKDLVPAPPNNFPELIPGIPGILPDMGTLPPPGLAGLIGGGVSAPALDSINAIAGAVFNPDTTKTTPSSFPYIPLSKDANAVQKATAEAILGGLGAGNDSLSDVFSPDYVNNVFNSDIRTRSKVSVPSLGSVAAIAGPAQAEEFQSQGAAGANSTSAGGSVKIDRDSISQMGLAFRQALDGSFSSS